MLFFFLILHHLHCIFGISFILLQLFYNVLVSAVLQSKSVVRIHISPLLISFPFQSPHSTEQSSFCYTVSSYQFFYFIHSSVYICQSQSPISSHLSSPACIYMSILYIYLSFQHALIVCKALCLMPGDYKYEHNMWPLRISGSYNLIAELRNVYKQQQNKADWKKTIKQA